MKTINNKIDYYKEQRPAGQVLKDFEKMMKMLTQYFPKPKRIRPESKRYWQISELITYP